MAGDGPPEVPEPLAVPCGDLCVCCRQIGQGEETGAITNVVDIRIRDAPQSSFPQKERIIGIEKGEVGLRLRAGSRVHSSQGLHSL
jgi:hypothetical protein